MKTQKTVIIFILSTIFFTQTFFATERHSSQNNCLYRSACCITTTSSAASAYGLFAIIPKLATTGGLTAANALVCTGYCCCMLSVSLVNHRLVYQAENERNYFQTPTIPEQQAMATLPALLRRDSITTTTTDNPTTLQQ